ncbi:mpv17-like protein 2 [Leguminivora glycinivorella]|uniref:mpv17-like protein 2 n=1 Tax=Leguminivora glycinivorella TaxID=1035111 RepID=UPI00200CE157|nr:mpv17-like protein 2 [Leguminivora glycinivorella]
MHAACGVRLLQATSLIRSQHRSFSAFHRGIAILFKPKNLLLTNSITSGVFMLIGDLAQQEFEYRCHYIKERYDWARSARMLIVGAFMGPLHHWYYIYLDKVLPQADIRTVGKKIAADQLFASPATILLFFIGMGMLENKSIQETKDEIVYKFKYTYVGDCLFWPPIQFINFYFLPTKYRVFYINGATMLFNVFLSYIKHYDQH